MKFVITGANGQLGVAFQKELISKGLSFVAFDRNDCNIVIKEEVEQILDVHRPSVLINCAAYNFVDEAESNKSEAFEINVDAVKILGGTCYDRGVKLVHYSSDYVFDGKKNSPYYEEDAVNPLNIYGQSKYEGEQVLSSIMNDYLIFRTSWVYGDGQQNFLYKISQWAKKTKEIKVSSDEVSVPTFVDDIVNVTLKTIEKKLTGLYHLTSSGYASRFEWANAYVNAAGLDTKVSPVSIGHFQLKAQRPIFSAMSNQKISKALNIEIPSWQEGIEKYIRSMKGK